MASVARHEMFSVRRSFAISFPFRLPGWRSKAACPRVTMTTHSMIPRWMIPGKSIAKPNDLCFMTSQKEGIGEIMCRRASRMKSRQDFGGVPDFL